MSSSNGAWTILEPMRTDSSGTCESKCGAAVKNLIGKMTTRARVFYARTFGGDFMEGKLLLGRWGIIDEYSKPNRIFLDFDMARPVPRYSSLLVTLRTLKLGPQWLCYSRTHKGWHVTIHLRNGLRREEIVAAQAILGSDKKREMLNLMRVMAMNRYGASPFWRKRWNILYSRKLS